MCPEDRTDLKSITEVASLLQIPQHVLRVWEGQFSAIAPVRARNGRRYYSPEVVDVIRKVQELSVNQGFEPEAIRAHLDGVSSAPEPVSEAVKPPAARSDSVVATATIDRAQLQQLMVHLQNAHQALAR